MNNYIFTQSGFYVDGQDTESAEERYEKLYHMGFEERPKEASASEIFLYEMVRTFFQELTSMPDLELLREHAQVRLSEEAEEHLLESVPYAIGAEYINERWLSHVTEELALVFQKNIASYPGNVELYLTEQNQQLHVPERIFLHLVENKEGSDPFVFMATYASMGVNGTVQHMPLKYALTEYQEEREKLLALLACLNRAAEVSPIVAELVESGEMFHVLRFTSEEAYQFLLDVEAIEKTGILCRIPNWWRKHAMECSVEIKLGEEKPSMLGFDTLVSLKPQLSVDGTEFTQSDVELLLAQTEGLAFLKGKWVEVNHKKLRELLKSMENMEENITLREALQLELGSKKVSADVGALVTNGKWLNTMLQNLRKPSKIRSAAVPRTLHATLRPYQKAGYTWLNYMNKLGFGACLADDMGLGKTIQVLTYLEKMRKSNKTARSLLIVPASLIGNWEKEAKKFVPEMDIQILHGKTSAQLSREYDPRAAFLTITTYGMAARIPSLEAMEWTCVILDEAQAIKNPGTKQTREIKKLKAQMRIAMTGTPIENDLTNLWSLFDFINHGLLGTSKEFHEFAKNLEAHPEGYAKLKSMISPFMLRRVKTDKTIIDDLPEKVEMVDYAMLTKKQTVLYRKTVSDMEQRVLEMEKDGTNSQFAKKGIVLATIMKLKQICNHPDQYLGQEGYAPAESGKFQLLKEICETIYEKRERVLVFTQFKEIADDLAGYLETIFHAKGYVLHGGTPVAKRTEIVEAFQGERYVPFIVLSVKAGGTGLNLTKANHVVHFDRWWNPAVENQATDRAFRIGQTKDVMVHKFVCQGTIEEKIDAMLASKRELAENVIGSGSENWITELSNEELFSLLRLE